MMHQNTYHSSSNLDKVMKPEQFNQIVEAILSGKYSWACVLILRFAGYNPLHYIPYRTYNRLMKEHYQRQPSNKHEPKADKQQSLEATASCTSSKSNSSKIKDLGYVELVGTQKQKIRGSTGIRWLYETYSEFF